MLQAADVTRQRFSGRGKAPTLVLEPRFCPQGKNGEGCESAPLRRLKRLSRRLEQLRHFCSKESLLSWRASRLWKNICTNHRFLQSFSVVFSTQEFPSLDILDKLLQQMQDLVRNVQARETSRRVKTAQAKLRQNWKTNPSVVYSKVDPELVNPTFLLRTPSGPHR